MRRSLILSLAIKCCFLKYLIIFLTQMFRMSSSKNLQKLWQEKFSLMKYTSFTHLSVTLHEYQKMVTQFRGSSSHSRLDNWFVVLVFGKNAYISNMVPMSKDKDLGCNRNFIKLSKSYIDVLRRLLKINF
jgi:hypothetical protein